MKSLQLKSPQLLMFLVSMLLFLVSNPLNAHELKHINARYIHESLTLPLLSLPSMAMPETSVRE